MALVAACAALLLPAAAAATPGDLDATFGNAGKQLTDFGLGPHSASAVAIQADGKLVIAGSNSEDFALARYDTDGTLDSSFGSDGVVITDFSGDGDGASAVLIQPDGKIVAAGAASFSGFAVARYNSDGTLDTTFSGDGKATADGGSARAAALQPDGKIVVAGGGEDDFGLSDFALARFNTNGTLDTTFSGDGKQYTGFDDEDIDGVDQVHGVTVQDDGKIVAAGYSNGVGFAVARYNSDGTLDTTFSGDGKDLTAFSSGSGGYAAAVAVQDDGKIVAAGAVGFPRDLGLARYNSDGSLDSSFSGDGVQTADINGGGEIVNALAIQSDGKLVVAGTANLFADEDLALARFNPDGALDTTFSGDGTEITPFTNANDSAEGVALQADGKIVAVGRARNVVALARYGSDGTLDAAFSGDGKQTTSFNAGGRDRASAVTVQPDGKILAVGDTAGFDEFALARYNPDGTPDTTFSGDGKQTTPFGVGFASAAAVALQPDGRIVVAGSSGQGIAVARYNPDGSLDESFGDLGRTTSEMSANSVDGASAVAIQPDGKIVAGGRTIAANGFGEGQFALVRFNPNGTLDTTFSGDGKQTTAFANGDDTSIKGLVIQPADSKIVAVGSANVDFGDGTDDVAVARYLPNGSLDPSFSGDGVQRTDFAGSDDSGNAVALQPNGKIVVSGGAGFDSFGVTRYNTDGSPDSTFAGDGTQITTVPGAGFSSATGAAVQGDGKIVISGTAGGGFEGMPGDLASDEFAVMRYTPDGSLDATFAGDGMQTTDFAGGEDEALGLALQPDGAIIVAGGAPVPGVDFALARYDAGEVNDAAAPETTILGGPDGNTTDRTPTFTFSSTEPGSSFECRVDADPFADCNSPHTTATLSLGAHTFEVRATDAANNTDTSAASRSFTVVSEPIPPADPPPADPPPADPPPADPPPADPPAPPAPPPSEPQPEVTVDPPTDLAPAVTLSRRAVTVDSRGRANVRIACADDGPTCSGRVTLTTTSPRSSTNTAQRRRTKRVRLGSARFRVRAGDTQTVRVRMSRSARKLLAQRKRLRVKMTAKVGARTTVRNIVLKAPKAKRRRRR